MCSACLAVGLQAHGVVESRFLKVSRPFSCFDVRLQPWAEINFVHASTLTDDDGVCDDAEHWDLDQVWLLQISNVLPKAARGQSPGTQTCSEFGIAKQRTPQSRCRTKAGSRRKQWSPAHRQHPCAETAWVCLLPHQANSVNDTYCIYRLKKGISMKMLSMLAHCFKAITHHYVLHTPEHVGPFAGSLLPLIDWQHRIG